MKVSVITESTKENIINKISHDGVGCDILELQF